MPIQTSKQNKSPFLDDKDDQILERLNSRHSSHSPPRQRGDLKTRRSSTSPRRREEMSQSAHLESRRDVMPTQRAQSFKLKKGDLRIGVKRNDDKRSSSQSPGRSLSLRSGLPNREHYQGSLSRNDGHMSLGSIDTNDTPLSFMERLANLGMPHAKDSLDNKNHGIQQEPNNNATGQINPEHQNPNRSPVSNDARQVEHRPFLNLKMVLPWNNPGQNDHHPVVIIGGGIVGLVLAIALRKEVGITAHIYEQSFTFQDNVGAGLGLYPNGNRVLRDLGLLEQVAAQAQQYETRRWERHDGTTIHIAHESVLTSEKELESMGIERWKLQKILMQSALELDIPIHFGKKTKDIEQLKDGRIKITFKNDTCCIADVVFAADGAKSAVRSAVANPNRATEVTTQGPPLRKPDLDYTGTTCFMGITNVGQPEGQRGIHLPCSTNGVHAVFFPTSPTEQCFQFHFPIPKDKSDPTTWTTLSNEENLFGSSKKHVSPEDRERIADRLCWEGWDDKYTEPLRDCRNCLWIGFCLLDPFLDRFVYANNRIILLGDAAHPPVPYLGQGAQMGIEDAGVITQLLQELCLDKEGVFSMDNFSEAMELYDKLRVPRTRAMLDRAKEWGYNQFLRSSHREEIRLEKEEDIMNDVEKYQTLSLLYPGVTYDYNSVVERAIYESDLSPLHPHISDVKKDKRGLNRFLWYMQDT